MSSKCELTAFEFFKRNRTTLLKGIDRDVITKTITEYSIVIANELAKGNTINLGKNIGYLVPYRMLTHSRQNKARNIYANRVKFIPVDLISNYRYYTFVPSRILTSLIKDSSNKGEFAAADYNKYANNLTKLRKPRYEI